jgi:anti-sigma B factor antagonist
MSRENKNLIKKTIKPGKNIETSMVQGLKGQILSLLDQGVKEITIDFSGVEDFDSNGLGLLIGAHNSLKGINGKLKMKNASDKMNKFIQTTHLDKCFDVVVSG